MTEWTFQFECRRSEVLEAVHPGSCYCEMWNLTRTPIHDTAAKIALELLKDVPPGITGIPGLSYSITQPIIHIKPDMQITASNGGKCYNVFIDVSAEFEPGRIQISGPSVPVAGVKVPSSATATVGAPSKSRLQAEYRLCCCEYDDDTRLYDPNTHGDLKPRGDYVIRSATKCKFDHHFENLSCSVSGDTSVLGLAIIAPEGECSFEIREAVQAGAVVKAPGRPLANVRRPKP